MKVLHLLFCVLLLSGCASSYRTVGPPHQPFQQESNNDPVQVGYRYNVLQETGNNKNARKAEKKGVQVVALRLTNTTDRTLVVGQDIQLYAGEYPVTPLSYMRTYNSVRQKAPLYLLYLPLTHMPVTIGYFPVGLVIGPGVALGNMFYAKRSNKKLLADLREYKIDQLEIKPGETVYGLVGLRVNTRKPITAQLLEEESVGDDYYIEDYETRRKGN